MALDSSGFNSRGMIVLGLAVVATVVLLAVVPKDGSLGGVRAGIVEPTPSTLDSGATTTTTPGATETTVPGTTETTKKSNNTKKGSTATTTTINPATLPVLRRGASGPDVVLLQQKLATAGFDPGAADGNFGNGTETQVILFQQSKNLQADGVVGQSTWAALG